MAFFKQLGDNLDFYLTKFYAGQLPISKDPDLCKS